MDATLSTRALQKSTAITATDHGQIVALAAWLCFTAGVLLSVVRIYVRWPLNALAGKDDIAYAVSMLFAIVQTAMTLDEVRKGFGKIEANLEEQQIVSIAKTIYATDLIFLFSIWSGKLSVSLLFTRLAKESNKVRIGWGLTMLISVFSIISIFSVALRSNVSQPWVYEGDSATSTLARWIATGAMSIVTDIIITILTIHLVWELQMGSKPKSIVITAFALRLFVAPITIVRLVSLSTVRAEDLSFTYTLAEAMTQLEMYSNLIATTLPCLRVFLTAWNTSFMDIRLEEIDNNAYREHVTSHSGTRSKGSGSRSQPGGSSRNHGSHSGLWAASSGKSKTLIETGSYERDNDAASDNSESAIVVKRTVDVSNDHQHPGTNM